MDTEITVTKDLKEGDIFSWRYADEAERVKKASGNYTTVYWCRSQRAVFHEGRLRDTYWYSGSEHSYLNADSVVLTFLGNPEDMQEISIHYKAFYRPEDVVDMNHANNSGAPVYVKGERDPELMKAYYASWRERFEGDIRLAQDRIKDCDNAIADIERGELNKYFPSYRHC